MKTEANDFMQVIQECSNALKSMFSKRLAWKDDEKVIGIYQILYDACYAQIHTVLVPERKASSELELREIIKKYVIGYTDSKTKTIYIGAIKPIKQKVEELRKSKSANTDHIHKYADLYDNFLALAAFRSLEHFALYMENCQIAESGVENDKGGTDSNKIIENTKDIFSGWYYYANKMVLDGSVKFIEKQLPTSYGKSYSDVVLISFIFGVDINNDVIKVFGNPYNCSRCIKSIVDIMCRKSYAKVFPYFEQFNGNKNEIFETKAEATGEFKIRGSKCPTNLLCVGKESKISGTRAKFIFLDDITQAEDANSIKSHDEDIKKYNEVWSLRTYGKDNKYIIASGTTYSTFDILSYLKQKFGGSSAQPVKRNKYTKVAKSNEIIQGGYSVFVCVPKLDYETDESTYPAQFDTAQARKQRDENYRTFMAMEQQQPLPPVGTPYYYEYLQEYDELPEIGKFGRTEYCQASIDPKRSGADFCAMPIFTVINEKHYLVDVFYEDRPMKDCYPLLIDKIIKRNIRHIVVENNISVELKNYLTDTLKSRGFNCKIDEVFNHEKKEDRISYSEADIKNSIVFPKFGMYSRNNPIGAALTELYNFSYKRKNEHDDFTDAVSNYSKHFIQRETHRKAEVKTFNRRRNF